MEAVENEIAVVCKTLGDINCFQTVTMGSVNDKVFVRCELSKTSCSLYKLRRLESKGNGYISVL